MAGEELRRVSRSLYKVVNGIIGDDVIINIRRTTTNLRDDVYRKCNEIDDKECEVCYSGSKAEGLRFMSSDEDWMFIKRHIKVVPSNLYMSIYDINTTLLLMENEMTKPGFTLLRIICGPTNRNDLSSTIYIMNGRYLSCKRWRELHTAIGSVSDKEFTHGPCASAKIGSWEYDLVFCLRSDIWPNNAYDCIRRLNQSDWPSHATIRSIVNDGVLFVPIGAKQSIFENIEWRMSFSLAEKKLIHAMNHTQFLCYGLLKLFLKEAIDVNSEVKGLLCSYFLKTALFWEITTTTNQRNRSTLLSCFWGCFRRLLQWINCSYCPNFFVPQNNMFEGKIEGTNRNKLLQYLGTLYYEGYRCLLRCQSLSPHMSYIVHRPDVVIVAKEQSNSHIARNIIKECFTCTTNVFEYNATRTYFIAHQLVSSSHKRFLLKTWFHWSLIDFCMTESYHMSAGGICNRSNYQTLIKRINIVERCRTDSVCHFLYQAMMCYSHGRYNKALKLIHHSKEKFCAPTSMCMCEMTQERYREAGGDNLPIETMLKKHFIDTIRFDKNEYIPELYIEGYVPGGKVRLCISPRVFAFFLQYLCHRKLRCLREANEASYELSLFLQHRDGQSICTCFRGRSWQVLGVCQQMSGNDEAAFNSYFTSLRQDDNWHPEMTCFRIGTLLAKYFRQNKEF